jgi:hypothetical protein
LSLQSNMNVTRGLGLFYDFNVQMASTLELEAQALGLNPIRYVVRAFFKSLQLGTVPFGGLPDPTGLEWYPRSPQCTIELGLALPKFADYLATTRQELGDFDQNVSKGVAPAGAQELERMLRQARNRKSRGLLAHLTNSVKINSAVASRDIGVRKSQQVQNEPPQFPREHLVQFLLRCFRRDPDNPATENETASVMALMLFVYGIRYSEALHLFVHDVQSVDGHFEVLFFHPEFSPITINGRKITRRDYLQNYCNIIPRNDKLSGKYYVGWKGMAMDVERGTPGYPVPVDGLRDLLEQRLLRYMREIRPALMRPRQLLGLPDHPFMFVSSRGAAGEISGSPYTADAFRSAWSLAMGRLRILAADDTLVEHKELGTTLHGARHLYGSLLNERGLSERDISHCMHHLSPFTQRIYTKPRAVEVHRSLEAARLRASTEVGINQFRPAITEA